MSTVFIGPRVSDNGRYGGVVVLFENLIENLEAKNIRYSIIDSNSKNYSSRVSMLFLIFIKILFSGRKHISLHGTATDYLYIGTILFIRRVLFFGRYSLRKFAGNYDIIYSEYGFLSRFLIRCILKNSDANFFETKRLVNEFKKNNPKTYWFPNVRRPLGYVANRYRSGEVFKVLFLSQVMKTKGIHELILAVSELDDFELDIIGDIVDGAINASSLPKNVRYLSSILPTEVQSKMSDYHVLALPTYHDGEGYPGVIIEAFMVSLPVITTNWNSIPELVEDDAILIEPRDPEQLKSALLHLKNNAHDIFFERSGTKSTMFCDEVVTAKFFALIGL